MYIQQIAFLMRFLLPCYCMCNVRDNTLATCPEMLQQAYPLGCRTECGVLGLPLRRSHMGLKYNVYVQFYAVIVSLRIEKRIFLFRIFLIK